MRKFAAAALAAFLVVSLNGCSDDSCPVCPVSPKTTQLAILEFSWSGGTREIFDSSTFILYYEDGLIELPHVAIKNGYYGYTVAYDTTTAGAPAFFAKISDGIDDFLSARLARASGLCATYTGHESLWIKGGTTGTLTPDLFGSEVEAAVVHVDTVAIESPGHNPNGDGIWTDYTIKLRLVIMGRLVK